VRLETLLNEVQTAEVTERKDCEITAVVCDSRQVKPGSLFVAVQGEKQDGRQFIDDAIERGAAVVVSDQDIKIQRKACLVRVADARLSLAQLAHAFNGRPSDKLDMVGITGTNGKTTTAWMIRDILNAAGRRPGLVGTIEYEIGSRAIPAGRTTPEAPVLQSYLAQMVNAECDSVVMEVSSHSLVQKRVACIDYDVGVFTNLTHDHLDYHKTMESYFEAKSILFQSLGRGRKKDTVAVINTDDPWGQQLIQRNGTKAEVLTYGMTSEAMVKAMNVNLTPNGSCVKVQTTWGKVKLRMKLLGRYNIYNALAAVAASGAMGIELDVMAEALGAMTFVPGRLEEIKTNKGFHVFVDYAHTDDALENVLTTLREITDKSLIVVFGCGGNRDRSKRPLMGGVATRLADRVIVTSDNPRKEEPGAIIEEIKAGCQRDNYEIIEDRTEAIKRAIEIAQKGDVVLIAGKGHEAVQEFANTTIMFDDRQVVRKYL
jgi:UDP-N-acetylmuramoyl-L-alanyl-D-glutamate--2,6-diaminopimelate ligase